MSWDCGILSVKKRKCWQWTPNSFRCLLKMLLGSCRGGRTKRKPRWTTDRAEQCSVLATDFTLGIQCRSKFTVGNSKYLRCQSEASNSSGIQSCFSEQTHYNHRFCYFNDLKQLIVTMSVVSIKPKVFPLQKLHKQKSIKLTSPLN